MHPKIKQIGGEFKNPTVPWSGGKGNPSGHVDAQAKSGTLHMKQRPNLAPAQPDSRRFGFGASESEPNLARNPGNDRAVQACVMQALAAMDSSPPWWACFGPWLWRIGCGRVRRSGISAATGFSLCVWRAHVPGSQPSLWNVGRPCHKLFAPPRRSPPVRSSARRLGEIIVL